MDGDGSIQVNHWRKKSLQYRLVIKLSNLESNVKMLTLIQNHFKGYVRITPDKNFVVWTLDYKQDIINAIKVFDKYPPLTSRLTCGLSFLKYCLINNDVETYLSTRNNKYSNQSKIIQDNANKFNFSALYSETSPGHSLQHPLAGGNLEYFNSWLSGFIEAEGCFSIRKSKNSSFSISQKNDLYILNLIKSYLGASNKIRTSVKNKEIYSLEIYKKETLLKVINHCEVYPLLGAKYDSFLKFKILFE